MTALDHIAIDAFGQGISIDASPSCAGIVSLVADRLPPFRAPALDMPLNARYRVIGTAARCEVIRDGGSLGVAATLPDAADLLIHDLQTMLAQDAVERFFVHAGVVALAGRALILPGSAMAGKTSLVAALLGAGADYVSDEFAVIDAGGRLHPYARPLSLRTGSGNRRQAAADFGALTVSEPIDVGAIVCTEFAPQLHPALRRLPAGQTVLRLLEHSTSARSRPDEAMGAFARVAAMAPAFEGPRGEAALTAATLIERARAGWT